MFIYSTDLINICSFWYFSWILNHFEKRTVYLKRCMKIKRTTDVLLEQDYMSIMWKQWLCWNKIILIGLKTFRINGKLIISNFTLMALQCQRFFQINSYFLHKRGLQIVIAENTSLLSEQTSFCLWNWISSPSSTALFHQPLKQCKR